MNYQALIVEDSYELAEMFGYVLQEVGLDVEILTDGARAMRRLRQITPQLVVLDLHLPQVSGLDVLNFIRRDGRLVDTKVIVITADPQMGNAVENRADLVLVKPITYAQLSGMAMRLLQQVKAAAQASALD
jgi:DNA-binding response OmpR family regulator